MPRYRITFDVATRCRTVVNAATAELATRKVYDSTRGDPGPNTGENPQPRLNSEIIEVGTRRRIVNVVEIP